MVFYLASTRLELFYCDSCFMGLELECFVSHATLYQVSYRASLLHQKSRTYGYAGYVMHYGKSVLRSLQYMQKFFTATGNFS